MRDWKPQESGWAALASSPVSIRPQTDKVGKRPDSRFLYSEEELEAEKHRWKKNWSFSHLNWYTSNPAAKKPFLVHVTSMVQGYFSLGRGLIQRRWECLQEPTCVSTVCLCLGPGSGEILPHVDKMAAVAPDMPLSLSIHQKEGFCSLVSRR